MKQTFILILLALLIFDIQLDAQTKKSIRKATTQVMKKHLQTNLFRKTHVNIKLERMVLNGTKYTNYTMFDIEKGRNHF